MDEISIFIRGMVQPFITDMGEKLKMTDQSTGEVIELCRYAYWDDMGRGKPEVKECSDDLKALQAKYNVPDNHVVDMTKFKNKADLQEEAEQEAASPNTKIIVDYEGITPTSGQPTREIATFVTHRGFHEAVQQFVAKISLTKQVVQFIDANTGETLKGPMYDTTTLNPPMGIEKHFKPGVKQQEPFEDTQYEPRDRYQENSHMNEMKKFRNIVQECIAEIKKETDPRTRLKESLRSVVKDVLKEIANVPEKLTDEAKVAIQKGYFKKGNERLDKTNEKLQKELETIVHGIDPNWQCYWDDHNQLVVLAQNLLYVRIVPKFENNYDIDAMVKLVDRVRAISQTWEQVKAFVKENFGNLKNQTIPDQLKKRALDHYEDREVIKKDAGPEKAKVEPRYISPDKPKIKDTKKSDKDYNEPQTKREEDMPDKPMKQVTEPGKDPESKNKNIKTTDKVKPPKHKNDKKLKASDKKTPKFTLRKSTD